MSDLLSNADLSGIPNSGQVIIGLSGGADSMALTHFLMQNIDKNRIICAHVNHMLRGVEADEDEFAVKEFCGQNNLRFALIREDILSLAAQKKIGTEECGRMVRYDFFGSLAKPGDVIVTAHNADDNAETVLMNIASGAGISGLCGIPYMRDNIVRPLIRVTRSEIEEYCRQNSISYVNDSSNTTDDYTRNRIRHKVIPELLLVNPQFIEAATRLSDNMKCTKEYILKQAGELLEAARGEYGLKLGVLKAADKAVLREAVKGWLESSGSGRLSSLHVDTVCGSLENGSRTILPGGKKAECSCGFLTFGNPQTPDWEMPLKDGTAILPNGKTVKTVIKTQPYTENSSKIHNLLFKYQLDCDTITHALVVRNKRDGDKLMPTGRKVTKSLKKLFAEMQVPVAYRNEIAVITSGGEIVCVQGVGVAEKFSVTPATKSIMEVQIIELVEEM